MFLIKDLVAANVHSGQQKNKWNPRTSSYLYATHDEKHIIDLEQSIIMLRRAMTFVKKVTSKRGTILYVPHVPDSKKGVLAEVLTHIPKENYASKNSFGKPRGKKDWQSIYSQAREGNDKKFKMIRLRKKAFNSFSKDQKKELSLKRASKKINSIANSQDASWTKLFKPEQWNGMLYTKENSPLESQRSFEEEEEEKHENSVQKKIKDKDNTLYSNLLGKFHGRPHQNKLPGEKKKTNNSQGSYWLREETELPFIPEALFVANLSVNKILIKEATKLQIPIIGILNNDSNPFGIHFPIPGNNDSAKASALYLKVLIKTLSEGKKKELKQITSKKK